MSDAVNKFEEARKDDRVVSQEDLNSKLSEFTVTDWRAIRQTYDKNSELVTNMYVDETEDAFVVHNDKDAIHDARITSGAWGLVRGALTTGTGYGLGALAMRFTPYGKIAGTALGLLSGYAMYRSDQNHINHLESTAYPLTVPKSGLKLE